MIFSNKRSIDWSRDASYDEPIHVLVAGQPVQFVWRERLLLFERAVARWLESGQWWRRLWCAHPAGGRVEKLVAKDDARQQFRLDDPYTGCREVEVAIDKAIR